MKILNVTDKDFDFYNDWVVGDKADEFIAGDYTHICDGQSIIHCEVLGDGLVAVGEQVYVDEDN